MKNAFKDNIWSDAFKHLTLEEVMSDITDVQNSLNINFTGIHVFDYLFSGGCGEQHF